METDFETIILQVRDYISPECTCKVEDIVNALPHVVESSFDPINGILKVKVHKGMTSAKEIIDELKKCPVHCEQTHNMPKSSMEHMEHEAMNMPMKMGAQKPAMHDHHAMMEAELKRSFIVAAIFTIPSSDIIAINSSMDRLYAAIILCLKRGPCGCSIYRNSVRWLSIL